MKKMLAVMITLLIAWAMLTAATTVNQGQTTNGVNQLDIVGGLITGTNTGQGLQFNAAGKLLTSGDGGVYRLESTSLLNTDIPALSPFKTNTPVYAQDISSLTGLISFAAADTDSVALMVYVIGKISGNAADGFDFPIDMNPATKTLDGIIIGNNAPNLSPYFASIGADSTGVVWAPTQAIFPQGTAYPPLGSITAAGAQFSICPRSGAPPKFSYYSFWVVNLMIKQQLDDVSLMFIVKGN